MILMVLSLIGPIRLRQLFDFVKVRSANPPSFSKSSFYGHIQASFFSLFLHLIKSVLAQIHGAEKRHVNRLTNRGQFPADIRPSFWPTFYQFSAYFRLIFGRYPAYFRRWSPECRLWLDGAILPKSTSRRPNEYETRSTGFLLLDEYFLIY